MEYSLKCVCITIFGYLVPAVCPKYHFWHVYPHMSTSAGDKWLKFLGLSTILHVE